MPTIELMYRCGKKAVRSPKRLTIPSLKNAEGSSNLSKGNYIKASIRIVFQICNKAFDDTNAQSLGHCGLSTAAFLLPFQTNEAHTWGIQAFHGAAVAKHLFPGCNKNGPKNQS